MRAMEKQKRGREIKPKKEEPKYQMSRAQKEGNHLRVRRVK